MPLENGHFNPAAPGLNDTLSGADARREPSPPIADYEKRPDASGTSTSTDKWLKNIRHAGIAGFIYMSWAIIEVGLTNIADGDLDYVIPDTIALGLFIGLPTFIMVRKRGFWTAIALTLFAFFIGFGTADDWLNGDPEQSLFAAVYHFFFAALFLRGALACRALKKAAYRG